MGPYEIRQVFPPSNPDNCFGMSIAKAERILADFHNNDGQAEIVVHELTTGIVICRTEESHAWLLRCAYTRQDACESSYRGDIGIITDIDVYQDVLVHRCYLRISYKTHGNVTMGLGFGTLCIPIRRATDAQEAEGKDMRKLGFDAL